ncbi:MAG: hybrid sensor histidine kinase/response regulator [Actinomycetota bacterium]
MTFLDQVGGELVLGAETATPSLDVAVLEDDAQDAELLCRTLRQAWTADVRISVFPELVQLERALCRSRPDVVFCDLGLPDADGIEVVERVVSSAGQAPVVVLTGNDDPTIPVLALRSGAQDYLVKDSLMAESLARALRYALARSFADGQIRRIAAELQEANGELDQYAGIVAHDLRAPVRTARLFADRLKAAIIMGADPIPMTSYLESSLERIESLIERLLRMSTLRNETLDRTVMELSDVIEAIGVYVLADLEKAEATLEVLHDGTIAADPILFQELVLNMVHNSLKYRHPDRRPEITFSLAQRGEMVELTIADNGLGIEPEFRERVFDLFERVDSGRSDGFGFGLAFCRRVADLHDGTLAAVDPPSGQGAAFRLRLPAADLD